MSVWIRLWWFSFCTMSMLCSSVWLANQFLSAHLHLIISISTPVLSTIWAPASQPDYWPLCASRNQAVLSWSCLFSCYWLSSWPWIILALPYSWCSSTASLISGPRPTLQTLTYAPQRNAYDPDILLDTSLC